MIYGSVCSGIEAATVAWHPLGWRPSFFSEIDKFPRAVLAHHYPHVPLHGDFTTIGANDYDPIDILVGGTPCQSFSLAGLRGGMLDARGNLALEFIRLAQRLRPCWILWENVAGVLSSNKGRDFGSFLGALAELGYGFAYRVLDAQYFGVPQRRRRVFLVGYLGDWRPPGAVLFERESLCGDITPSREERKETAGSPVYGIDEECNAVTDGFGPLMRGGQGGTRQAVAYPSTGNVAHCLNAGGMGRQDYETETLITHMDHPYTLAIRGRRGGHDLEYRQDGIANAILTPSGGRGGIGVGAVAIPINTQMAVRRLTPRECERLQGFPDDYTLLSPKTPDGSRYKALGNSMAVPVMRQLGERIETVDKHITIMKELQYGMV